jgi:hypothetical protein
MLKLIGRFVVLALIIEGLFSFPRNLRQVRQIWPQVVEARTGETSLLRYMKNNW